jgi:DNA-binding XRE family transcriptional regulator
VAHDASITTATLGVIERGLSNPTWATVKNIGAALDVSIGELAKLSEKFET